MDGEVRESQLGEPDRWVDRAPEVRIPTAFDNKTKDVDGGQSLADGVTDDTVASGRVQLRVNQ